MEEEKTEPFLTKIAAACYRLVVAGWLGGAALFTFVLTPILFRSLNRDQAGAIVGYLFPGYFRWGLACGIIALSSLVFTKHSRNRLAVLLLLAMLSITSFQAFVIEPQAAALKKEISSFETTPADHPLRVRFRKLHGISAVGNLAVIGGGVMLVLML